MDFHLNIPEGHSGYGGFGPENYNLRYRLRTSGDPERRDGVSLLLLFTRYGDLLWEPGSHKYNVTAFINEMHGLIQRGQSAEFTEFTDQMMDDLIAGLRLRNNGNATINRKMAALSKLLRKAHKMGDISGLPEFHRQKEKSGRIRFLSPEEETRLFMSIAKRSGLYERFCIFLVDTGARLGEGIGLRWCDIHNGRVTFWLTKSGRSRSVPLTERSAQAIAASGKSKLGPFSDIDQQRFRKVWNLAKREAGLDERDVVPHTLRHTCASRLVQGGIDIRRVQTWLGHQTIQMTMRYAHLAAHDLDVCVPVLERYASPEIGDSNPSSDGKPEAH